MKKFLFFCCLIGLGGTLLAQINMQGCNDEWGAANYILNNTGTTNDGGTIRNTYQTTPINALQACPGFGFGFCEMRIAWDSGDGRWEIDLDDTGGGFFNIFYNTASSVPNPPDLTLGTWIENTVITGNLCGTGITSLTGDVQGSIVLPVSWASFELQKRNHAIELNWSTYQETNNQRFEVERKRAGGSFERLEVLPAQGERQTMSQYAFTDLNPYPGENVYRIKQVDLDGQYSYSKVRSLVLEPQQVRLLPESPDALVLSYPFAAGTKIRLLNLQGQELFSSRLESEMSAYRVNLTALPKGIYLIEVQGQNLHQLRKWIVP